jgi:2-phosphoglycerate kinase
MKKERVTKLLQAAGKAVLLGAASGIGKALVALLLSLLLR